MPTEDPPEYQNWYNMSGTETNKSTWILAYRQLATNDSNFDVNITVCATYFKLQLKMYGYKKVLKCGRFSLNDSDIYVLWSYGETDDIVHHKRREYQRRNYWYARAVKNLRSCIRKTTELVGLHHPLLCNANVSLSLALSSLGLYEEALVVLMETLDIVLEACGPFNEYVVEVLFTKADIFYDMEAMEDFVEIYNEIS